MAKQKEWVPLLRETSRIAGHLLRAHRSGEIVLHHHDVQACIECLTQAILATHLRQQMGRLWHVHGPKILLIIDKAKWTPVDDRLAGRFSK